MRSGRRAAWIGWAVLIGVLLRGSFARADCGVVPGADGEIATWLATAPEALRPQREAQPVAEQLDRAIASLGSARLAEGLSAVDGAGVRADAIASDESRLSIAGTVRGARMAVVGADLEAAHDVNAHLFLGGEDGIVVLLDGHEIERRALVRDLADDDVHAALTLAAGRHHLAIVRYVNEGPMRLVARLVGPDFRPTSDVRVILPGVDDARCDALAAAALHAGVARAAVADGTHLEVTLSYPGGSAWRANETSRSFSMRAVPSGAHADASVAPTNGAMVDATASFTAAAADTDVELRAADPASQPITTFTIHIASHVRAAILRAETLLAGFDDAALPEWLPRGSVDSVHAEAERLAHLVAIGDDDDEHLADTATQLDASLDALAAQRDPYAGRHGALRRAYRSEIDGSLQQYSVYVPPAYHGDRPFPMIVVLHGLGGTAHRMLAVIFGLYDEHESHAHADRHLPPLPDARAIIVAPYGFGDTGYRQLGEADIVRVVDEVERAYRIDTDRVYMTGLSMGGIGAGGVPLHDPDLFAATAALCGYHSYFVRNDTQGVHQPWETFLMEARSNASWAENGLHLPLYVVHGTRDRPVANSRVLVDRYTELHYRVESEWPDLGHNVWSTTYANGRIIPYFLQFRRDRAPRHVRFRTAGMRWRSAFWVHATGLAHGGAWGDIDADVDGDTVQVATQNLVGLVLDPPASLFAQGASAVHVRIDGDVIDGAAGETFSLVRDASGHWTRGATSVQPALGPIRDVFDRPIVVVYGTQRPDETAMNLRVAHAWARVHPGVHAHIAVVRDTDVTDAIEHDHALVLVGTPGSNRVLASIASRLPIRVEGDAVVHGSLRYAGSEVGATFVAPNPDVPEQAMLVVTGTTALGVWRSRFLPDLVPDYAIYDASIAPARGRIILGSRARMLEAGFFDPPAPAAEHREPEQHPH